MRGRHHSRGVRSGRSGRSRRTRNRAPAPACKGDPKVDQPASVTDGERRDQSGLGVAVSANEAGAHARRYRVVQGPLSLVRARSAVSSSRPVTRLWNTVVMRSSAVEQQCGGHDAGRHVTQPEHQFPRRVVRARAGRAEVGHEPARCAVAVADAHAEELHPRSSVARQVASSSEISAGALQESQTLTTITCPA